MSREELATLYICFVARAKAAQNDVADEFRSRYQDALSHELIEELHRRNTEALELLIPSLDVPRSGK